MAQVEDENGSPRSSLTKGLQMRLTRADLVKKGAIGGGMLAFGGTAAKAFGASGRVARRAASTRTVTIIRGVDFSTLEVRKAGAGADLAGIRNIAEPLIRAAHSSESDLQPWLATSWSSVAPTRWRFKIRPGVKFSDGTPFDVETVKWTIDHLDKESQNVNAIVMHAVDGATIVDKNTIDILTAYPSGAVPAELQTVGNMLDPTWEMSSAYSADKLVGTGSAIFDYWNKGSELVMTANPNWWNGRLTYDQAVWKPIADPETRANAAATLEADIVKDIQPQDVPRLMAVKGLTIKKVVSTRTAEIRIQDNVRPFDNILVRQALNYAVDIPSIIKNVFKGYGKANNGQTIGSFALAGGWQPQLKPYPYDPSKAKSLLAKAGYPSGFSTTIGTPQGKDPGDYEFVQAVAGYLQAVGIQAQVILHEIGQYESMYSGLTPADPLFYYSSGNFIPNVENALVDYLTPASFVVHDATVTKYYNKLTHTVDPKERAVLAMEVQSYLRNYAPCIFGYQIEGIFAVSDRVDWTPRAYLDWIYLDEIHYKG